jgi:hypothetical protein
MVKRLPLGRVIAQRELIATETGGVLSVQVGMPRPIGGGWDWACPCRILGLGKPIERHVHGVDALQTLQLVSAALRDELERSGRAFALHGCDDWRWGFPRLMPVLPIPGLEARLEGVIDAELSRTVEQVKRTGNDRVSPAVPRRRHRGRRSSPAAE